jgi:hypothetical protein
MDDSGSHIEPYVGAPAEYARAEEVPDWVATLVKILVALPMFLAALTVFELILVILLAVCVAAFLIVLFVL